MKSKHTVLMEAIEESQKSYHKNRKSYPIIVLNSLRGLFDAFDDYQREIPKQESEEKK